MLALQLGRSLSPLTYKFSEGTAGYLLTQDHPGLNREHPLPFPVMYFYCQVTIF